MTCKLDKQNEKYKRLNEQRKQNSPKIHEIAIHERPTERLRIKGAGSLSDAELLAVILRTGTKQENVVRMCQRVLSEYSLAKLSCADCAGLMKIHGIGKVKAAQITAVFELSRRLETFCEEPKRKIKSPDDVYHFIYPHLREKKREKFIVLYMDTKNQIIRTELISIGSLNSSVVHPREIFKPAFLESSASVILVHNHPSGDSRPSTEDIAMTQKVYQAGKILGIDVLDHIIIGDKTFTSLKQDGYF